MNILGIDPGPKESAYIVWDGKEILSSRTVMNVELLGIVSLPTGVQVAIEWITGYGMRVGAETFETCRWVGRFEQAAGGARLIPRKDVVLHLCGHSQAGDKFVRQALIDRIGEPGTKKKPGPTYGIAGHEWAALAVAVVAWDEEQVR